MNTITAQHRVDQEISDIVEGLKMEHPELELSFGYVGNVGRRYGDDRSFRIFTNRRDSFGHSVCYHLGGYDSLPAALERLRGGAFDSFAARAKTQDAY